MSVGAPGQSSGAPRSDRWRTGRWRPRVQAIAEALAIALGVSAAILAVGVNHGLFVAHTSKLDGLSRSVVVVAGTAPSSSGIETGFSSSSLTAGDVTALGNAGYVPDSVVAVPTTGQRAPVSALSRATTTDVVGTTERFTSALGYTIASGRFLTPADVQAGTAVAVIGTTVVNTVFAGSDPVGQDLQIDGQNVQIVGVFTSRGFSGAYDQDNLVVLPITAAWRILTPLQQSPIDQVLLRASTPARAAAVAREVTSTLLARHGLLNPAQADFTVRKQADLLAPEVAGAQIARRSLEIGTAAFLLLGALQVAVRAGAADRRRTLAARLATVTDALPLGLAASIAGAVLAVVLGPVVHRLASSVPSASITIYGLLAGMGLGLLVTVVPAVVVSLIPGGGGTGRPSPAAPAPAVLGGVATGPR